MTPDQLVALLSLLADLKRSVDAQAQEIASLREELRTDTEASP